MIKAIIWDMDGVIIDSEDHHHAGEIATFKHFGVEVPEDLNKQYKGAPLREHFQELRDKLKVETPLNELMEKQNEHIYKMYSEDVELFSEVKDVLFQLKKQYVQALATSSERRLVEVVLKRFGLQEAFTAVTCGDEVDRGKPEPDIFLKTAKKLGVLPEECVVIEDAYKGIKAGKAAKMTVIAHKVSHNKDIDFSLADFVVTDLNEVRGIVDKINEA